MKYAGIQPAVFVRRLNRFAALVEADGQTELVHVKNTGRLGELLLPGARVFLTRAGGAQCKTRYDLVSLERADGAVVNIDSQAPNAVCREWLCSQPFDWVRPEVLYGASRIDFAFASGDKRYLMEVKGCTLERDGVGYFPDAPTERGARHMRELKRAAQEGIRAIAAFVIQMEGVREVRPNTETDPAFAQALAEAEKAGVRLMMLPCLVTPDSLLIDPSARRILEEGEAPCP